MRQPIIVLTLACAAACSGRLEPGPIGKAVDMRQYLPDSLRAATSAESTFRQNVLVGPDSARVELTWTAFRHGPGRYLGSLSARLLDPVSYDSLALGQVSELVNVGTKFEPTESAKIGIGWFKRRILVHRSGSTPFSFEAQGRRTVWPPVEK